MYSNKEGFDAKNGNTAQNYNTIQYLAAGKPLSERCLY